MCLALYNYRILTYPAAVGPVACLGFYIGVLPTLLHRQAQDLPIIETDREHYSYLGSQL
jgi:hypothetical protein